MSSIELQSAELCRRYGVQRLDVFGSAVSGRFNPKTSDLDFLVTLADRQPTGGYADRYLDLADALEKLFQRPVDLITEPSIRNPYFRREVEATRQLIYVGDVDSTSEVKSTSPSRKVFSGRPSSRMPPT